RHPGESRDPLVSRRRRGSVGPGLRRDDDLIATPGDLLNLLATTGGALAQFVPVFEAFLDLAFEAALARPVEVAAGNAIREIVLARKAFLGGMVVDVALAVAEVAHEAGRRVQYVHRRHQGAGLVGHAPRL